MFDIFALNNEKIFNLESWLMTSQNCYRLQNEHQQSVVSVFHRMKMKNQEYESMEHIEADLMLMFENAKRYNVPHSHIYKRALKLQHILQVSATATQYNWT